MNKTIPPFFSIIIPTHNRPQFLSKAVKSVLSQKYQNFEIIVVNDASVEDYSKIEEFLETDNRISYFRVDYKNRSKTRNFGIDKAKGDWICFLDDDDIYYDNHLEVFNKKIQNNLNDNFYHTLSIRSVNGKLVKNKKIITTQQGINRVINFPFHIHSIVISKKFISSMRFNENLHYMEDVELWMRLSELTKINTINVYTNEYVFHANNTIDFENIESMENRLNAFLHLKNSYSNLGSTWISDNIYKQHVNLCSLYFDEKTYKKAFYHFKNALGIKPKLLFTRWTLGKIKRFIIT